MILTITPNPAWDVTYGVAKLLPGEVHRITSVLSRAGGKGINVARIAKVLGRNACAVAPVGGHRAARFEEELTLAGVTPMLVKVEGALRTSVAILPQEPSAQDHGDPTLLNEPGPPLSAEAWAQVIVNAKLAAADAKVATISGSLPPGIEESGYRRLIETLHDAGCVVLADTVGVPLMWAARAGVDLLKPNRHELLSTTQASEPDVAVAALRKEGAGAILMTAGTEGMFLWEAGSPRATMQARLTTEVYGNPTGAGDAAFAAIACHWDEPWSVRLTAAVATSAASVLRPVAGEVLEADIEAFTPMVEIRTL